MLSQQGLDSVCNCSPVAVAVQLVRIGDIIDAHEYLPHVIKTLCMLYTYSTVTDPRHALNHVAHKQHILTATWRKYRYITHHIWCLTDFFNMAEYVELSSSAYIYALH